MASIITLAFMLIVFVLKLAWKTRLFFPLVYVISMLTVFKGWMHSNLLLAEIILGLLLAIVVASWIVTLVRYIQERFCHRLDRRAEVALREQLRAARAQGIDTNDLSVRMSENIPYLEY